MSQPISTADPHPRRRAAVLDTEMACVSNAEPGSIPTGAQRDFCGTQEITFSSSHFIREDSPAEIGQAIAALLRGIP